MQASATRRFAFRIRTRAGLVVENLQIPGRSAADAERKVQQLYRDCVILENHSACLLYTSPSPRDRTRYRMPSSA